MMYNNYYNVPPQQAMNGGYTVPFQMQMNAQKAPVHSTLTKEEAELMKKSGGFYWKFELTPEEVARGHCNHYNGTNSTVTVLNEEDPRHPGCDVLHCNQCNTTWTDMSTKPDEWWRDLGKDVVSAYQTLKYMNLIPTDATRTLGDMTELTAKTFFENVPGLKKAWAATYNGNFDPVQGQQPFYNAFNGVYNTSNWGTQYGYQSMAAQMNPYMVQPQMQAPMTNPMQNPMQATPMQNPTAQQPIPQGNYTWQPQAVPQNSYTWQAPVMQQPMTQNGYTWQAPVMQNPVVQQQPQTTPMNQPTQPQQQNTPAADQKKMPVGAASGAL